jgi:carbonic anhydrase
MNPIEKLKNGFERFKNEFHEINSQKSVEYTKLVKEGQQPKILMIACSDSRVAPEILFHVDPGDLFTVRNIANLVPPYEMDGHRHGVSAAIEYAVDYLRVEHIIVKGHANCGGIAALMKKGAVGDFISPWMSISNKAREEVLNVFPDLTDEEKRSACEKASILVSLENLLTFPFVKDKHEGGKLRIHGWYFDMNKGELLSFHQESKRFQKIR